MKTRYPPRRDVRWNKVEGYFEMACGRCRDLARKCWWELDRALWNPASLQLCRACRNDLDRERRAAARWETVEARRKRDRDWYHSTRAQRLAWKKANYVKNRVRIRAAAKARYAAKKANQVAVTGLWEQS